MAIWSAEAKELEKLYKTVNDNLPILGKEIEATIKTRDENVVLLYARRCLEVIVTELCETELNKPRKTEPLKGIIDKLNSEDKVPSHIITSMQGLNSLATYGTHPKDFDPEQVKPVLNNLAIIIKWYLRYKGIEIPGQAITEEEKYEIIGTAKQTIDLTKLEKSVAILPFKNDSPDEENTYFINGLMEEVLNNLQRIKDLRVISRTSVEQYRNQTKSIPEIAKELGVNYIVEGSGQKYGNAFRLRTQLIMAVKESHLWGESFQQEIKDVNDIFRTQSLIAETIAKELKAVITPQEKDLIEKIPTTELSAYDAYLNGKFYWRKITQNDLDTAMQYFERAKEIDPNYALAYAGICDVWVGRQQMGYSSPDIAGPKAFEAAMKALELDSTQAEVHYTLALMKTFGMWDWEGGELAFRRAIELNPNFPEARAFYSSFLNMLGRSEEAIIQSGIAIKLDPYNPLVKSLYAGTLLCLRRYEDAIIATIDALNIDPANLLALSYLAMAFHLTKRYDEALEKWKLFYCNTYKDVVHDFDKGYAKAGYVGALSFEADTLTVQSKTTFILPSDIAILYTLSLNKERALECLEQAYEIHDPGSPGLLFPIFDNLREQSRFQELGRKMNIPYK